MFYIFLLDLVLIIQYKMNIWRKKTNEDEEMGFKDEIYGIKKWNGEFGFRGCLPYVKERVKVEWQWLDPKTKEKFMKASQCVSWLLLLFFGYRSFPIFKSLSFHILQFESHIPILVSIFIPSHHERPKRQTKVEAAKGMSSKFVREIDGLFQSHFYLFFRTKISNKCNVSWSYHHALIMS